MTTWIPTDADTPEFGDGDEWVDLNMFNSHPLAPTSPNGSIPHDNDSWQPINLADLPDTPPVQPTLGGLGIVYPGKRHVFSGPQESAKTLAAYAIGLQVVRENQPIVVIDFEMGRYDARNRLRELGATPDDFRRIHYLEPSEPAKLGTMTALVALDPALVIIDAAAGAYDLQSLDDNKRSDVEKFTRLYVQSFWRAEIATIVLDHVTKDTENRGKYAIGSERKTGGADVHLGFETITPIARGGHGHYKVITHKDRGGYLQRGKLADLHLRSDPETHEITWELKPAEHTPEGEIWYPTALMTKVSVYMSAQHEPTPRTQIYDDVTGKETILRKAIDHLVRLGYLTETAGPRGAKLVEHERLFHENDLPKPVENPPYPTLSPPYPGEGHPTLSLDAPPYRGAAMVGDDVEHPKTNDPIPHPRDNVDPLEPPHDLPL